MQKRIFHLSFCIVLLISIDCFAGGTYQVGQDQGGIYFQTDNDGGWYIGKSDLKDFKIGQTGTYSIEKDRNGTFLLTDKNRKFYLDTNSKDKQDIENAKVNQEYERKMEIMRQKEARKNAEQARLKAQEQEARADIRIPPIYKQIFITFCESYFLELRMFKNTVWDNNTTWDKVALI